METAPPATTVCSHRQLPWLLSNADWDVRCRPVAWKNEAQLSVIKMRRNHRRGERGAAVDRATDQEKDLRKRAK
jgi:hypothetical protein